MISINTNLSSLVVQSNFKNSSSGLNKSIKRMTTGYKVNSAKDNAAGFAISVKMSTKIGAFQQAEENASMGLNLVQTASSSLDSISNLASRLKSLATQAQNGTYGSKSIEALQTEAKAIVKEINRIKNTTQYNGISLFCGESVVTQSSNSGAIATLSADTASQATNFTTKVEHRDTTAMTSFASVDENKFITSGTYSISTAKELAKLATMANKGNISSRIEFVLANDIDLSGYSSGEGWIPIGKYAFNFISTFDGNGYSISNLYINKTSGYAGLFGDVGHEATIKNVCIENANITSGGTAGALIGFSADSIVKNCYSSGEINGYGTDHGGLIGGAVKIDISNSYSLCNVYGGNYAGGLMGSGGTNSKITNCYATGNVSGKDAISGLVSSAYNSVISNCYATGRVDGQNNVGGLISAVQGGAIENSYATGKITGKSNVGGLIGRMPNNDTTLTNTYFTDSTEVTKGIGSGSPSSGSVNLISQKELQNLINQGILPGQKGTLYTKFQIGTSAEASSQITLELKILDTSALNSLSLESKDALSIVDEFLKNISAQQTNLGAVENRLVSALEEISTNYENLLSSRSTLRDADMAKESSEYIRNQILQQASATLLATTNQNPAIALQLI